MVKNLYSENHRILLKQIKEDTNNGKAGCTHALETILLRCSYYPEWSAYSMKFQSKSLHIFFRNRKSYSHQEHI